MRSTLQGACSVGYTSAALRCDMIIGKMQNFNHTPTQVKQTKKGVYTDGHERDDVVRDRQERFLPEMAKIMEECVRVREDENGTISIENEEAEWIVVVRWARARRPTMPRASMSSWVMKTFFMSGYSPESSEAIMPGLKSHCTLMLL